MGHDADSKLHYQRFMHDLPTKYGFTHPQGHGGQQWPPLHQPMYPPMYSRRGGRRQQHHYDEDSDSDSGYDSPGRKKPSKSKKSKHGPSAAKEEVPHFIVRLCIGQGDQGLIQRRVGPTPSQVASCPSSKSCTPVYRKTTLITDP
jgi:hypothetical protein